MKHYLFIVLLFISPLLLTAQIRDFCELTKEVLENETQLSNYKGIEKKEELWIGKNYESSIKISGSIYTVLNISALTTAMVACMYDGTELKESNKLYESLKVKIENCLGVSYKTTLNNKKLSNGDVVQEIIFKQVGYKNKTQTIVIQYTKPSVVSKKNKVKVLLIFPQNGFYI